MGIKLHKVRRSVGTVPEQEGREMDTDVRDATVVWVVFKRNDRGPHKGIYELMGIAAACGDKSAEEMAEALCADDRYWIAPVPVNVALPDVAVTPKGQRWPKRPSKTSKGSKPTISAAPTAREDEQ